MSTQTGTRPGAQRVDVRTHALHAAVRALQLPSSGPMSVQEAVAYRERIMNWAADFESWILRSVDPDPDLES